jgi:hypothetical protein
MIITNFKLIDFLNQPEEIVHEYSIALSYVKPSETRNKLAKMTLRQVEYVKRVFSSGGDVRSLIKIVSDFQDITEEEVLDIEIIDFYMLVKAIKEQLMFIYKAENNAFKLDEFSIKSDVDLKWEIVGGSEKMAPFGIYNTLESLSGGDLLKYSKIMEMQYSEIFTILVMKKTALELRKRMDKIKLPSTNK